MELDARRSRWLLFAVSAVVGCASAGTGGGGARDADEWDGFGVIVGQLWRNEASLDTIPIAINGVGSGVRAFADGRFLVRTNQRTVALSFPATCDTLRLAAVRLDAGDTLVVTMQWWPRRPQPLLCDPPPPPPPPVPPPPMPDVRINTTPFRARAPLWVLDEVLLLDSLPDLSKVRVERMEMQRGAAMASRFGSRASGGVVFVTSRRR